tara:strand:- start:22 stop:735 length:714 start_codon:yes stop_codon:yes gene_type:complete
MEWLLWYFELASGSVYFIAPLGVLLWLVYRLFKIFMPNSSYLPVPFVIIGVAGFCFIEAYPGYNFQLKKTAEAAKYPHFKAHVLSQRIAIHNPITWIWSQPTGYAFVRPTEANFMVGHKEYSFGAEENTFLVKLSTFDYENSKEDEIDFEYKAACKEKIHSLSGPDNAGVMRWLKFNEPMGELDFKIYCETDYSVEYEVLKCMRKILEKSTSDINENAIEEAGKSCTVVRLNIPETS